MTPSEKNARVTAASLDIDHNQSIQQNNKHSLKQRLRIETSESSLGSKPVRPLLKVLLRAPGGLLDVHDDREAERAAPAVQRHPELHEQGPPHALQGRGRVLFIYLSLYIYIYIYICIYSSAFPLGPWCCARSCQSWIGSWRVQRVTRVA